jgi:hypothetical protein
MPRRPSRCQQRRSGVFGLGISIRTILRYRRIRRLAFEREYTLRKLGYSEEEIKTRSISVKKDQKNRSQTRRTMIFEPFMIISEKTRRWIAKRKCLRNTIDNESNNESMISSCRDSTITSSTALEMSSSYAPSHNFMTENIMVCNQ